MRKKIFAFFILLILLITCTAYFVIRNSSQKKEYVLLEEPDILFSVCGLSYRRKLSSVQLSTDSYTDRSIGYEHLLGYGSPDSGILLEQKICVPGGTIQRGSGQHPVIGESYKEGIFDWKIIVNGVEYCVNNWKYEGKPVQPILSGQDWCISVVNYGIRQKDEKIETADSTEQITVEIDDNFQKKYIIERKNGEKLILNEDEYRQYEIQKGEQYTK